MKGPRHRNIGGSSDLIVYLVKNKNLEQVKTLQADLHTNTSPSTPEVNINVITVAHISSGDVAQLYINRWRYLTFTFAWATSLKGPEKGMVKFFVSKSGDSRCNFIDIDENFLVFYNGTTPTEVNWVIDDGIVYIDYEYLPNDFRIKLKLQNGGTGDTSAKTYLEVYADKAMSNLFTSAATTHTFEFEPDSGSLSISSCQING